MPHRRASRSTCGGSGGEASDREPVSSAIQRLAAVSRAPVAREWARAAPDAAPRERPRPGRVRGASGLTPRGVTRRSVFMSEHAVGHGRWRCSTSILLRKVLTTDRFIFADHALVFDALTRRNARSEEASRRAAEDGARAEDVTEGRAREHPREAEGLDHVVVRLLRRHALVDTLAKALALDGHAEDGDDVEEHHHKRLRHARGAGTVTPSATLDGRLLMGK